MEVRGSLGSSWRLAATDDRSGKVEKTRVSVTLTRPYLEALNHLVGEGVYLRQRGISLLI